MTRLLPALTTPSGDLQILLAGVELFGGLVEQRRLGGRGRIAQLHAADLDRQAAPGRALLGRQRGVALHELDHAQRHIELFGDDLRQRRRDAGAEIDLAGIDRDHAFGDRSPESESTSVSAQRLCRIPWASDCVEACRRARS